MRSIDQLDPMPRLGPKIVTRTVETKTEVPVGISNDAGKMRYVPIEADRVAADLERQMRENWWMGVIPPKKFQAWHDAPDYWPSEYVL